MTTRRALGFGGWVAWLLLHGVLPACSSESGLDSGAGGSNAGGSGGIAGASGGSAGEVGSELDEHGYRLVWSDEFDGAVIDASKWEHEVNCWGGGNNEEQCYVADAKNSFVEAGQLHLVALADSPSGAIGGPGNDPTVVERAFSSARLRTLGKADFKYGRFEARLRLPFGQGLWPAFWMLPLTEAYGGWAQSGEIDIMEAVNASSDNNLVYGTLHYGGSWPANVNNGTDFEPSTFVGDDFHEYAVEWEEGEVRWFVDDQHYATQDGWYSLGNPFPAPFDQQFYLLLNVAVGGSWPGPTDGTATFPQEMVVDYVRVYECADNPDTAEGCGSRDPSVVPLVPREPPG